MGDDPPGAGVVQVNNMEAAAAAATFHLISLGHRRIAYVGMDNRGPVASYFSLRREGFKTAMWQRKLPVPKKRLIEADCTLSGGYQAAKELLDRPLEDRPSAIVGATDDMAVGIILAAKELHLSVPAELSVIGIDGNEVGEAIGLTTVDQFAQEQGRIAAARIIEQLSSPSADPVSSHRVCQPELVARTSTGVPLYSL